MLAHLALISAVTDHLSAQILWENDLPIATRFNDVYYSRASGMAETRHVFLKHNHLPERFGQLTDGSTFTVGETGFGTGLNFLCTWQLFLACAPANCTLHFISTEKYPLKPDDLNKALSVFDELMPLANRMIAAYRLDTDNIEMQFNDAGRQIKLTVLLGDVLDTLPNLNTSIDAWFLDGFAPAKNPDMWQPALFAALNASSHDQTTYATFTAARVVRDGLAAAGFSVEKHPGFGRKRDMIAGQKTSDSDSATASKPWFSSAQHHNPEKTAIVVGGGLAGCSAAYGLVRRGWQVTVLEQHNTLASEASGNPQGVLYAKLSPDNTPLSQFILHGYQHTLATLTALDQKQLWQACGVVQLAMDAQTQQRYQALDAQHPDDLLQYLDKQQLSNISGLSIDYPGLLFPQAGWVQPPLFCQALADHANIQVQNNATVHDIEQLNPGWLIKTSQGELTSKTLIIAQGVASSRFSCLDHLPLKTIRGQITQVQATAESRQLATCVNGEGYIAPAMAGYHTLGATFDVNDTGDDIRATDHDRNLAMQARCFPAMYQALGAEQTVITGGRTGFRCTTPDYLPVIGPIVDRQHFMTIYAPLRKNCKQPLDVPPKYLDGLYVTAGHGSRGIISCPIAGELLAATINGESTVLPQPLLEAIHPSRFLIRDLIRNKR